MRTLLFEPLEVRHLLTATVNDLHLLTDTGSSSSDLVTSDPQVTGIVQGNLSGGYVEVQLLQFDHFGDGNVDGYTYVYSVGSQVTYDPRSDDYSLSSYTRPEKRPEKRDRPEQRDILLFRKHPGERET